jgi:hypothetical protein
MGRRAVIALAIVSALAAAAAAAPVLAASPTVSAQAQSPSPARAGTSRGSSRVTASPASREETHPTWAELTAAQQRALAPLGATWRSLSEAHKRKWLALSRNYPRMSADDQSRLHSRMTEWANLSPQQRTQARLNFAETKRVAVPDKKAAWQAYQALPPEEKKRLAAGAAAAKPPPPPTAAAVRPVPPAKLARVPQRKATHTPGIAVAPSQVDQNTLLPQPGAIAESRAASRAVPRAASRPASRPASTTVPASPAAPRPAAAPREAASTAPARN